MKFQVTFKDPDTLHDAAEDAAEASLSEGSSEIEKGRLIEGRAQEFSEFAGRWCTCGEYVRFLP